MGDSRVFLNYAKLERDCPKFNPEIKTAAVGLSSDQPQNCHEPNV
jgi:hypothetical protein